MGSKSKVGGFAEQLHCGCGEAHEVLAPGPGRYGKQKDWEQSRQWETGEEEGVGRVSTNREATIKKKDAWQHTWDWVARCSH
jgi:hypothetical protein